MAAPRLVAKGVGPLAERIRAVARAHRRAAGREPAARARAARRGRARRRGAAGPLPRGRRGDRLRAAAARPAAEPTAVRTSRPRRRAGATLRSPRFPTLGPNQNASSPTIRTPVGSWRPVKTALKAFAVLGGLLGTMPAAAAAAPPLFGTVEFRAESLAALPQWQRALRQIDAERAHLSRPAADADGELPLARRRWPGRPCSRPRSAAPPFDQLQAVNRFLNDWRYQADQQNYGRRDYWATPLEFLRRSGDCEDYAIIKYVSLRQLGFARRAAAPGGGPRRLARSRARGARGLPRRPGLHPGQSDPGGAAAGAGDPVRALLLDQRDHALGARRAGRAAGIVGAGARCRRSAAAR